MANTGTPPEIPKEFQPYNSYETDPKWARTFTTVWTSCLGLAIVIALPHLVHSIQQRRAFTGFIGIWEDVTGKYYAAINTRELSPAKARRKLAGLARSVLSARLWTAPGLGLNAGQIFLVLSYLAVVLLCTIAQAPLQENSNRAGFLALAQFPVVFLFATKNSILSLLLGPGNGYEKLNYIHRWSGRTMFLCVLIHGSLWIKDHLRWSLPIIGQPKETYGIASLGILAIIVLSSLKPVRRYCYQAFFVTHVLGFVSFFVTICYHTPYASPWIFPPLAFYGLDLLMRMFRYRIKDATLVPFGHHLTMVRVADCDGGWIAGQHVCLRVFFSGRVFESHPLTILSAPPASSCLKSPGLLLAVRTCGDWSKALNAYAAQEVAELKGDSCEKKDRDVFSTEAELSGAEVQVMLDGPYGGCSVDLGRYESVLLVAGGSGATFTLGLLDDIVARCVKLGRRGGEKTKRIEFSWAIKSFGHIEWFAPMLSDIAKAATRSSLDLHISVYVTCLCDPESIPSIPNSDVIVARPTVFDLLNTLTTPPCPRDSNNNSFPSSSEESARKILETGDSFDSEDGNERLHDWSGLGGGVAVCASGPESLTREAQNAVARLSISRGVELGGIALHTEVFSL